jgi:hypothetical protein
MRSRSLWMMRIWFVTIFFGLSRFHAQLALHFGKDTRFVLPRVKRFSLPHLVKRTSKQIALYSSHKRLNLIFINY